MSDFFDGLEDEPLVTRANFKRGQDDEGRDLPPKQKETFPCQSCAGTGKYRGHRTHQQESKCFACNGRGFFNKPYADAMREKQNRKDGRARALSERIATFTEEHRDLYSWMRDNQWINFVQVMQEQLSERGRLSENQTNALYRTREAVRRAERAAQAETRSVKVDLTPIHAMFDRARESGLGKLFYRAKGLVLSPAPASGQNAGAIYVKTLLRDGTYLGKVVGSKFMCTREATDEQKLALQAIAADPSKAARDYGIETGKCCCCGRELTDPASIADGIGPVCATKWGL